jgi:8-oxo-dGTP diphosphatase
MALHTCIACMLIQDHHVLAEQRKVTKKVVPGAIALPGGHMEEGESPEAAVYRELQEELGIVPGDLTYVCTLLHRSQEFRKLHYFAVHQWEGDIANHEAEAVLWVPFDALETFDLDVDRIAISEYRRVYQAEGMKIAEGRQSTVSYGDAGSVSEALRPGNKVTWWKRIPGGDYVYPIQATVLALTAKRVKIKAEDDGEIVMRYVPPASLQRQE